jgi:hypothetical protein
MTQVFAGFYRDAAASLAAQPKSEKAQRRATRWMELLDLESDGDPGVRTGSMKAIGDRQSWPHWLKRQIASRFQLNFDNHGDIHAFIERALAYRRKR